MVAYVTAGAGHRRAAEALVHALRVHCTGAEIHCLDVLHDAPGWFHAGYNASYLFLVRHAPWVWKWSYQTLDRAAFYRIVQPLRRWWNFRWADRFVRRLRAMQPDAVLVTHFLPADLCAAGRQAGWLRGPLTVVVTDFHPHWFWISPGVDAVIAAVPESAAVLRERGVAPERVHVLGIPVGEAFHAAHDREALRRRFDLHPQRQTVLVTSGGTTVGQFEQVVDGLLALEHALPGRVQLLVVCGENDAVRERLAARAATLAMPMRVFGFVEFMAELMAVSDLVVSKAGGLTVSEALATGVPLVLYHIIPGQEQMNAHYLARHGAAVIAHEPEGVALAVTRVLQDPRQAQLMRAAAQALRRPDAADAIVTQVVKPLLARVDAERRSRRKA